MGTGLSNAAAGAESSFVIYTRDRFILSYLILSLHGAESSFVIYTRDRFWHVQIDRQKVDASLSYLILSDLIQVWQCPDKRWMQV